MARNLLPHLRQTPKPANVPQAAVAEWTAVQAPAELGSLDLGGPPDDSVRQRVQSIPSPWARMLLFREAMDDPNHPARRLVENELLDAFQYLWSRAERPSVRFDAITVRVGELETMARQAGTQRAEWFQRALTELLPQRVAGEGGTARGRAFEAITIVTAEGRPVLGTSPYTLLFTAEDASDLPASEKGSFFHYAQGGEPRPLHQRPFAFQRYVAQVLLPQIREIGDSTDANTDGMAVQRLVKGWLERQVTGCRDAPRAGTRKAELDPPQDWRAAAASLDPIKGIVGGVTWYARGAGDEMNESHWLLRPTRAGAPKPVIVDPAQFDGRYVPDAPAVNVPADVKALASLSRDVLPGTATSYPWVSPHQDWFADRILVLAEPLRAGWAESGGGATAAVYGYGKARAAGGQRGFSSLYNGAEPQLRRPQIALPLKREILRFFTPTDLERMLEVEVQSNGGIVVTLHLPVGPEGATPKSVQRTYDAPREAQVRGPELVLWPSFRSARWRDYVLFQRDPDGQTVRPFAVRAVARGESLDAATERRGDSVYLMWSDEAPEAIEFVDALAGGGEPDRLGLVMPRYADAEAKTQDQWHVGVDFGTSNTVLSRRVGGEGAPQIVGVPDLTLHLTDLSPEAGRAAEAYFFPDALSAEPFATAIVRRHLLHSADLEGEPVALRMNVPFTGRIVEDTRNAVVGDLKWSTDRERRFLTEAYLRHVLLVLFAESTRHGVEPANVSIAWSFPRAFTPTQQQQFGDLWARVLNHVRGRLVAPGTPAEAGPALRQLDESRAVLRYFFNAGKIAASARANVVVDVGGGTSDIAVYGAGRTLALDSVLLGGRNLTGQRLQAGTFDQLSNPFVRSFVEWSRANGIGRDETVEARAVNTYLRDGQDHLAFGYLLRSDWYAKHGGSFSGDRASHAFQGLVLYFFGALFHHVGLTLRAVGEAEPALAPDVLLPSVVMLAGNGSRYIDWMTNAFGGARPGADALRPFGRLLSRLLVHAMGLDPDAAGPEVQLSPHPKLEVALGLVHRQDAPGAAASVALSPVLGEAVRLETGEERVSRAFAPTARLEPGQPVRVEAVPSLAWTDDELEITRFHRAFRAEVRALASYGAHWTPLGLRFQELFDALDRRKLEDAAKARLEYLASANAGFQGSLFLLEATTVLDRMLDDWFVSSGPSASAPPRATTAR